MCSSFQFLVFLSHLFIYLCIYLFIIYLFIYLFLYLFNPQLDTMQIKTYNSKTHYSKHAN